MTNKHIDKSSSNQVVIGAAVIVLGIAFLLDNLNLLDIGDVIDFWPAVFILIGIVKLSDTHTTGGKLVGAGFVLGGVLLTMNRLGYVHFHMKMFWPMILIAVGVAVVAKALANRSDGGKGGSGFAIFSSEKGIGDADAAPSNDASDDVLNLTAVLGGIQRRVSTQHFRGGELTAFMGGVELDLRSASMDGEAVVNVFAAMGGIALKVPPDWTVIMNGMPIMGGFEEKTIEPKDQSKRLVIKGYAIMGGVEVRN